MNRALVSMAACALLAVGFGLGQSAPGWAGLDEGKAVYVHNCADCHGLKGEGDGPGAEGMDPPPTSFAAGVFKHGDTDDALARSIRDGIPDTSMGAWKDLTGDEVTDVVAVIRNLKR